MIFCGDVAISGQYDNFTFQFGFDEMGEALFLNLEGAICTDKNSDKLKEKRKVFNIDKVVRLLQMNHVTGCILANNHITDFDDRGLTVDLLEKAGIKHVGYGSDYKDACQPLHFSEDNQEYSLLAFGWNVAGCKYAKETRRGVNAMEKENVICQVKREYEKGKKVIVVFHWNYVYELYPMPAHRELAKQAVDAGACLIVGCHSHCVQGVEFYKDVPIVYGLGNWIFDNGVYFDGRLKTKELGWDELAVEYRDHALYCHWFKFDVSQSVPVYINSEKACKSEKVIHLTPFRDMSDKEYVEWFKKNRRIHKFTPVFASNEHRFQNQLYYVYMICREKPIRQLRDAIRWLGNRLFI